MSLSDYKHHVSLKIDDDTYWELTKLAAELKMHVEDYVQNVLIGHVETELDRQTTD